MLTREEFAQLAATRYDDVRALKQQPTLLDYEQGFVEVWTELGCQVAKATLDPTSEDRHKKSKFVPPSDPSR